jgi:hypothetical protein
MLLFCYHHHSRVAHPSSRTTGVAPPRTGFPHLAPMQFSSKLSPEQWAEARRMRGAGATLAQIGSQFGVRGSSIGRRARLEGWPSPGRGAPRKPAPAQAGAGSPATAGIRARLAQRLYRVIECRIMMMEMRMQKQLEAHDRDPDGPVPPAPAKDERDSFAALIDSINQVTEMASEPAPAADGRRTTATGANNHELTALSDDIDPDGLAVASEKDQFRRELAEHLGRMFPKP